MTTTTNAKIGYTTVGRGSGCCGHEHTTLRGAEKCAADHSKRQLKIWSRKSDRAVIGPDGMVLRLPHDERRTSAEDGAHWRR